MSERLEVWFCRRWCTVGFERYAQDDSPAIVLEDEGRHIATATVWIPAIRPGYVAIKDYSENAGMLSALQDAGIVGPPEEWRHSGFVHIPVCKLLVEVPEDA